MLLERAQDRQSCNQHHSILVALPWLWSPLFDRPFVGCLVEKHHGWEHCKLMLAFPWRCVLTSPWRNAAGCWALNVLCGAYSHDMPSLTCWDSIDWSLALIPIHLSWSIAISTTQYLLHNLYGFSFLTCFDCRSAGRHRALGNYIILYI